MPSAKWALRSECRPARSQAPIGGSVRPNIEVVQGDITDADVDAVVNAANDHLWMGTGVAGAIVRAGGRGIEDEAMQQAPIRVGTAVITGAGRLKARHVIHTAVMGQDLQTDGAKIGAATSAALALAGQHDLRTIAFPALGTGVGGFPPEECARLMRDAVRELTEDRTLRTVRFVLFDEPTFLAFQRVLGA